MIVTQLPERHRALVLAILAGTCIACFSPAQAADPESTRLARQGLLKSVTPGLAAVYCRSVKATTPGWTTAKPPMKNSAWKIRIDASTGWSVDAARYANVGPLGHQGEAARALAPYAASKYRSDAPFGALLMRIDDGPVMTWQAFIAVNQGRSHRFDTIQYRINDKDSALGDNGGAIRVCAVPGGLDDGID